MRCQNDASDRQRPFVTFAVTGCCQTLAERERNLALCNSAYSSCAIEIDKLECSQLERILSVLETETIARLRRRALSPLSSGHWGES